MKNELKNSKTIIITLVSILVIISTLLIVSVIYNFNGGFYYSRISKFENVLGDDLKIEISGEGVYSNGCSFTGTILLGTDIKQNVTIQALNLSEPVYLRAKFQVAGIENSGTIFGYTNWVSNENYLYFNQAINSNEQIGLCEYVNINQNLKLESNLNYVAIFLVEAKTTPWQ